MAAALALGGCATPGALLTAAPGERGEINFHEAVAGSSTVSIRLIDQRPALQGIADADHFAGVYFELSNSAKLKESLKIARVKTDGVYSAMFTNLPSDGSARYMLKAGLYRDVNNPNSLTDKAYQNPEHRVGEGTSEPFPLVAGESRTVTLVINAVGEITFTSGKGAIDDEEPTFELGDATAAAELLLSKEKNPGATGLNYRIETLQGESKHSGMLASMAWSLPPAKTRLPLVLPSEAGDYRLVVELVDGSRVLSHRVGTFAVRPETTLTITGTPGNVFLNGKSFVGSTDHKLIDLSVGAVSITFRNESDSTVYFFWHLEAEVLEPGESKVRDIPVFHDGSIHFEIYAFD